jgi:hypothetical protein
MYCAVATQNQITTEARAVDRPVDTVTDYALRYRMDAIVITTHIDTGLKSPIQDSESNSIGKFS